MKAVAESSKKTLSHLPFLFRHFAGLEEIKCASQRSDKRREDRAIITVAPFGEYIDYGRCQAKSGAAEAHWALSGHILDRVFRLTDLGIQLFMGIEVQSRLVIEGMVSDLMPGICDRGDGLTILI